MESLTHVQGHGHLELILKLNRHGGMLTLGKYSAFTASEYSSKAMKNNMVMIIKA